MSREEFLGEAPKKVELESAEKRAERAFKVFDKNHDGFVTKDEMLKLCKNLSKEQASTNFKCPAAGHSKSFRRHQCRNIFRPRWTPSLRVTTSTTTGS